MPKPLKQRVAESDQRKKDRGLTRVSVWVPAEDKARIKRYAARLVKQSGL